MQHKSKTVLKTTCQAILAVIIEQIAIQITTHSLVAVFADIAARAELVLHLLHHTPVINSSTSGIVLSTLGVAAALVAAVSSANTASSSTSSCA